jgi:hypothetical protein
MLRVGVNSLGSSRSTIRFRCSFKTKRRHYDHMLENKPTFNFQVIRPVMFYGERLEEGEGKGRKEIFVDIGRG